MDELTPAEIAADFLAANPGQMYVSIGARQFERNSVMREAVQERGITPTNTEGEQDADV